MARGSLHGGERQVWQEGGKEEKPSGQEVEPPNKVEAQRKQARHWLAQKLQYSAHDFTWTQIHRCLRSRRRASQRLLLKAEVRAVAPLTPPT